LYEVARDMPELREGREMLFNGIADIDNQRAEVEAEMASIEAAAAQAAEAATTYRCPNCATAVLGSHSFCSGCGMPIAEIRAAYSNTAAPNVGQGGVACASCGAPMQDGDFFCMQCGARRSNPESGAQHNASAGEVAWQAGQADGPAWRDDSANGTARQGSQANEPVGQFNPVGEPAWQNVPVDGSTTRGLPSDEGPQQVVGAAKEG